MNTAVEIRVLWQGMSKEEISSEQTQAMEAFAKEGILVCCKPVERTATYMEKVYRACLTGACHS